MQSKMLLGALAALMTMCVLFVLAVPQRPGAGEDSGAADQPATGSSSTAGSQGQPGSVPAPRSVAPPELADGLWCPAGYGLCLPAPEGWVATRRRSRAYLHKDPAEPLAGNFSLISLPNLYGKTLESLLEENRVELEANPQFDLISIETVELDGRERLRVEYTGTPTGGVPVRFSGLIWLTGPQQVVLTFTAAAEHWDALEPELRSCMAGLGFGARPSVAQPPADAVAPR